MGFRVDEHGVVHVDEESHSFANTTVEKNPTVAVTKCRLNKMEIWSLLLRTKNRTEKREIGDNCPLIYALKKKEGLSVTYSSFKPLVEPINAIIKKLADEFESKGITYDVVIPMPSSHRISDILANKLAKSLNIPTDKELFRKSNTEDIEGQVTESDQAGPKIPAPDKVNIMNAVKKAKETGNNFSMSDVKTSSRAFIKPLVLDTGKGQTYRSALLVDDLFATGSTLIHAKNELLINGICEEVRAVVLFSPLNGRIRK